MTQELFVLVSFCVLSLFQITDVLAATAPLAQTGQTACYNSGGTNVPCAGTGQDGAINFGLAWPNPRFTDQGNGTVTDNLTALMWSKDANAPGPTPTDCSPASAKTWQGALDYAVCLNSKNFLGYNDWRVPSIRELGGLIDTSRPGDALPSGHPFVNVQPGNYWSSSNIKYTDTDNSSKDLAWILNISNANYAGYSNDDKKSTGHVWPVRNGSSGATSVALTPKTGQTTSYHTGDDGALKPGIAWPSPRFTNNLNGTITDNLTGLVWLTNANCFTPPQTWDDALTKANTLTSGSCGLIDGSEAGNWHLPNKNELWSLVDYGRFNPALPVNHPFVNVQPSYYWTSSSGAGTQQNAWYVNMKYGWVENYFSKAGKSSVWPVRSGPAWLVKPGDCSGNGTVTISDVQNAVHMFLGLATVKTCVDLDRNGSVSISEVQKTINSFLGQL